MKLFLANLAVNLCALACIGIAGTMVIKGVGGWGWFLLIAVICACTIEPKEGK